MRKENFYAICYKNILIFIYDFAEDFHDIIENNFIHMCRRIALWMLVILWSLKMASLG